MKFLAYAALASAGVFLSRAEAASIVAPVAAVIEEGGPGFGGVDLTFNRSGLLTPYAAGDDFDAYVARRPLHDPDFTFEWFSNENTTSARILYDLGAPTPIDGVAYWNEDAAGAGRVDLSGSLDGVAFFALLTGARPTNNPLIGDAGVDYAPDVFRFIERTVRYVRVQMLDCPQPEDGREFPSCSLGEIAFRSPAGAAPVPLPPAALLMAAGLALASARFKKKNGRSFRTGQSEGFRSVA